MPVIPQMKVCLFQGYDDPDHAPIIATFYTDRQGMAHVDNEAYYDSMRGIADPLTGRHVDGHAGVVFLEAVHRYFTGPGTWAGEVVPLLPGEPGYEAP